VGGYGIFVLVVDFDLKKPLDLLGGPHLDGVPGHSFANVHANLATDTFIEPDLHVRDHNIDAVGSIAGRQFDTIDRTKAHAGFAARAIIGYHDCDFLGLLFLPRYLRRSLRNDQCGVCFLGIVCHVLVHS